MISSLLIAVAFFVGFVIESMIGLGGTLIAYSILLFFIDTKVLIVSTIILPIFASVVILFSDIKNLSVKVWIKNALICLVGMSIGIYLFEYLPDKLILRILSIFLIVFGLRNLFFKEITIGGIVGKVMVFIAGIIQGVIGTGGPVAIIGMKKQLKTKAEVRVTMAMFFLSLNLIRIFQLSFNYKIEDFFVYYWVSLPIFLGIIAGHYLNKRVSEKQFTKVLSVFFIIAGTLLMFR